MIANFVYNLKLLVITHNYKEKTRWTRNYKEKTFEEMADSVERRIVYCKTWNTETSCYE